VAGSKTPAGQRPACCPLLVSKLEMSLGPWLHSVLGWVHGICPLSLQSTCAAVYLLLTQVQVCPGAVCSASHGAVGWSCACALGGTEFMWVP
jgi:hypothetical protein